ncbi:mucoidy inhibitor MuiA family protein [Rhodohalobacter sp.]|uniref:DUF4139 domain-containing protein n=1 Tax=Rhodohalobacter sp. TaxID=1974210 RepID=UPI002ACE4763|nr:mucoidy inhibitor MuiA family protein [Rhodohalobacter sp.]MDZ7755916.1 mucoidy inhibitor MuiA family protein [Rhodohalobacter sp.]
MTEHLSKDHLEVQLPAGISQVVFTGLTRQIYEETITLRTEQGSLTLLSLNTQLNQNGSANKREELDSLSVIKQNLEDEITLLNADQTNLTRELNLLAANQNLTDGQGVELSGLKEAMEYYRERYRTIESQKIETDKELARVSENLNEINRKINELENEIRRQSNEVVAVIDSPRDQATSLNLSYVAYRAGWTPSYDVRYSGPNSPLSLDYKAEIYQDTGEDWNRVSLAISSGRHQRGNTVPDISTEYVDFQPDESAMQMDAQRSLNEVIVTAAQTEAAPGVSIRTDEQIRFSYEIQEPHSIASGDRAILPFHREETAVDIHHITVPKLNSGVFLVAEIEDWESLHLIDGEANLFMNGSFTGKSRITTEVFEESLRLSLGQNDFILTERNRVRDVTSKNFFGSRTRENHGWEIVLRNTGNEPLSVTVKDQIPVSRQSEINVELTERSGAAFNESTGILEWDVNLSPGQTQTIPFSYRVEYPRDRQLDSY